MHPKDLSIADFTYDLPEDRIAKYPLEKRDSSKLLVFKNEKITSTIYSDLDQVLSGGTLLVFNNTKVVAARLLFKKPTGGMIEIFCLEPDDQYNDITKAMLQKGKVRWKCLIGGASKWKHGMVMIKTMKLNENEVTLEAAIVDRLTDCFVVQLSWQPADLSFAELLSIAGQIPLPPYLHREAEDEDKKRYQTIYANHDGSVAAPTAGLHFTNTVFKKLEAKNIEKDFVTLHVGAGTFKPVKAEKLEAHEMHSEFIEVSAENINKLINYLDKTIIAVGTTSLRTIETLYWMGLKVTTNFKATAEEIGIKQWDPYELEPNGITVREALTALQKWMDKNKTTRLITKTQILIAPGYSLKIARGIITNFHQPQSTLLLLISAIVGDDWKKIYNYALNNNFRFLSYGDGCLLWSK